MSDFIEVDAELVADFCAEVEEMLADLETAISEIKPFAYGVTPFDMSEYSAFMRERNVVEFLENMRLINRVIHTVKGNSSFMGFTLLNKYCHTYEELTTGVAAGKLLLTSEAYEVVSQSADIINRFLETIKDELKDEGVEIERELTEIIHCREGLLLSMGDMTLDLEKMSEADLGKVRNRGRSIKITIELDHYDRIVQGFQSFAQETAALLESRGLDPDALHEVRQGMTDHLDQLVLASQSKIQLSRYPRIVKDLSRSLDKSAVFRVNQSTARARPDVWDKCHNALVHMVRNAADHGVEDPATREEAGKSAMGVIEMDVYEDHKNIYVKLADDGKGIDGDAVAKSAINKGVITSDEADRMSTEDKQKLIFHPGFSTREEATNVSGRGVGMDAVFEEIQGGLGGQIKLESELGKGTSVLLEIPKAETLSDCILFGDDKTTYAIPNLPGVTYMECHNQYVRPMPGKSPLYTETDHAFPFLDVMQSLHRGYAHGEDPPTIIRIAENGDSYGFVVPEVKGHRKLKIERRKAMRIVVNDSGVVFGYGLTDPVIVVLDPEHLKSLIQ